MRGVAIMVALVVLCANGGVSAQDTLVRTLPPSVIRTVPVCGDMAVDAAATTSIEVTFSKDMMDGSWSFVQMSPESFPSVSGYPRYLPEKRTCVIDVTLEPDRTYAIWYNSTSKHNFMDADGNVLVPYLLYFRTK